VQTEALLALLALFVFVKYPREALSCGLVQFLAVLTDASLEEHRGRELQHDLLRSKATCVYTGLEAR
jgi:hypothetical protein